MPRCACVKLHLGRRGGQTLKLTPAAAFAASRSRRGPDRPGSYIRHSPRRRRRGCARPTMATPRRSMGAARVVPRRRQAMSRLDARRRAAVSRQEPGRISRAPAASASTPPTGDARALRVRGRRVVPRAAPPSVRTAEQAPLDVEQLLLGVRRAAPGRGACRGRGPVPPRGAFSRRVSRRTVGRASCAFHRVAASSFARARPGAARRAHPKVFEREDLQLSPRADRERRCRQIAAVAPPHVLLAQQLGDLRAPCRRRPGRHAASPPRAPRRPCRRGTAPRWPPRRSWRRAQ